MNFVRRRSSLPAAILPAHVVAFTLDGSASTEDRSPPTRSLPCTQATITTQATEIMIGPKNNPTIPRAIVPPMTPMMITGMGVVSPRAISNRPEHIVYQPDRNHVGGEDQGMRCVHRRPAPDDDRQEQDRRSDLYDTQQKGSEGEHAGGRNASGQEASPGEKRLQECDADHAPRHVAYGCAGQLHQFLPAVTERPTEEGAQHIDQLWSSREQESRNDDRDEELDEAEQRALSEHEQLGRRPA